MALEVKGMHSSGTWLPATVESLTNQTILNDNGYIEYIPACGPVAQLGARFHGMEEVVGSIPTRPPYSQQLASSLLSRLVSFGVKFPNTFTDTAPPLSIFPPKVTTSGDGF